jgi:predicted nucleic acid-binding protein
VKKTTAFWDSSALVPLCIHEAASRQVQLYLRKFAPVVWWGSTIEVHSALSRLYRSQQITDANKQGAMARLRLLSRGWREVLPDDQLHDVAIECLDKYALRSADSLQLAASLAWCQQRPSKRTFICGDLRLSAAAASCGFTVLELPNKLP